MTYYYLHPFKPQYFFPKGFEEHPPFLSLFKPYSKAGALSWNLLKGFPLYRKFFQLESLEGYIPEREIRNLVGNETLIAFNKGTLGPEQKITGLGYKEAYYFFLKYAQSPLAIANLENEARILKALHNQDFTPFIKSFHKDEKIVLVRTTVLEGTKLDVQPLDTSVLELLLKIAEQNPAGVKENKTTLEKVFSHGDFCPWNLMKKDAMVYAFDWEMGGMYPLGYDLFTFLLQPAFLMAPKKPVEPILKKNEGFILKYFNHFGQSDWKPYLREFARVKVKLESQKPKSTLAKHYHRLATLA